MKCDYDPTPLLGQPIGMFHCPKCGEMVLAGMEHPDYHEELCDCYLCLEENKEEEDEENGENEY